MIVWRFDDALAATERAVRLDSTNKEANTVMRKTRAVAVARWNGNEHFKASEFWDACSAYGEGLEHDPHNSVLLCNRAACRSKLGHFEKAIEDCTHALNLRPGYTKARLRRADCNFKVRPWNWFLITHINDYANVQIWFLNFAHFNNIVFEFWFFIYLTLKLTKSIQISSNSIKLYWTGNKLNNSNWVVIYLNLRIKFGL